MTIVNHLRGPLFPTPLHLHQKTINLVNLLFPEALNDIKEWPEIILSNPYYERAQKRIYLSGIDETLKGRCWFNTHSQSRYLEILNNITPGSKLFDLPIIKISFTPTGTIISSDYEYEGRLVFEKYWNVI